MNKIYYKTGYKYQVATPFQVKLVDPPLIPASAWVNGRISKPFAFIERRTDGLYLVLENAYAWDGATWALDSPNFRRGSACHDALLELIGLGLLPADPWKMWTDNFLIKLCEEDGMWWPRRKWVYRAVRAMGNPQGSKPRKIYSAP